MTKRKIDANEEEAWVWKRMHLLGKDVDYLFLASLCKPGFSFSAC